MNDERSSDPLTSPTYLPGFLFSISPTSSLSLTINIHHLIFLKIRIENLHIVSDWRDEQGVGDGKSDACGEVRAGKDRRRRQLRQGQGCQKHSKRR